MDEEFTPRVFTRGSCMLLSSVACNYLLAEEGEQELEGVCKEKYKSVKRGENEPKSRVFAIVVGVWGEDGEGPY